MDKNVSSVNLDELKAAREALDKEQGIESDPNMYNDYDPEKHKAEREQEKIARENASNYEEVDGSSSENNADVESVVSIPEPTIESNDVNDILEEDDDEIIIPQSSQNDSEKISKDIQQSDEDGEINLNIYDTFADFEINSGVPSKTKIEEIETSENDDKSDEIQESNEDSQISDYVENSSLDDFLKDLDDILSSDSQSDDDQIIIDDTKDDDKEILSENSNDEIEQNELDEEIKTSEVEDKSEEKLEKVITSDEKADYDTEILSDFSKISTLADEMNAEKNEFVEIENKQSEITDIDKSQIDEETTEENQEIDDSKEKSVYPKIQSFNFIDIMGSEEFKDTDRFSYLLGKNEEGELVFSHLKDTCGTVFFTRNEDAILSGFSSIILSLLLKNTSDEMQFVVCDAMSNSDFDVFEDSSYMYFNRIAKNNREIVDTLIELSKEIEGRYNNLVQFGVKSISAYNTQAEDLNISKMPYIIVFINNYAKMSQFLDSDKINTCIYNLLKFGRIVGVYVMLASTSEIERKEINYNLPTRIAYKTEDELESVKAIGFEGAENLTDEKDFLYSTVYDEDVQHLKVADLTKKEIELIIENLEN